MTTPPISCPHCGTAVPPRARNCPECGACEQTGWSEAALTDGLDLPDQAFDYEEFVKAEFGSQEPVKPRGISWLWWGVAVVILLALIGSLFWQTGQAFFR